MYLFYCESELPFFWECFGIYYSQLMKKSGDHDRCLIYFEKDLMGGGDWGSFPNSFPIILLIYSVNIHRMSAMSWHRWQEGYSW